MDLSPILNSQVIETEDIINLSRKFHFKLHYWNRYKDFSEEKIKKKFFYDNDVEYQIFEYQANLVKKKLEKFNSIYFDKYDIDFNTIENYFELCFLISKRLKNGKIFIPQTYQCDMKVHVYGLIVMCD
jgi:hypothetical protein